MLPNSSEEGQDRPKVLVADDSLSSLERINAILTLVDYQVLIAKDGEEAIQRASSESPDLVLIDAMMPGLSGYEVCQTLKKDGRTRLIPVIIMAPPSHLKYRLRGIEAGCDDFLKKPVNQAELLARARSLINTKRLNEDLVEMGKTVMALANAIEAKDPYTEGHLERVAEYASRLGGLAGLSPRECKLLWRGAILHDVGKIGIRESVLLKEGRLTKKEFEHIKSHTLLGERICQIFNGPGIISQMVRHHHEHWDGKGYPDGLAGEKIPLCARIMSVVDAYDVLTSNRPYRKGVSHKKAQRILGQEAGRQLDPTLVKAFLEFLRSRVQAKPLPSF